MMYLDNGATSFRKPPQVYRAVERAMKTCANPGRGGYSGAMEATRVVYQCRELAVELFDCQPEQVIFTSNCTHGLNIAIHALVKPGTKVVISGFEHNAVTRPLYQIGADITVAGRKLFDWEDTVASFEKALKNGAEVAIFTHVSNVFGYILPVEELAKLCKRYGVAFLIDAAQSAGSLPISLKNLGAHYIAMPGHKGLLGPQGTGILLCAEDGEVFMAGGTGSNSASWKMPDFLPDKLEPGTLNVPGIAGLGAGIRHILRVGTNSIYTREREAAKRCIQDLQDMGYRVFSGNHQGATVSFLPSQDCEVFAQRLAGRGIAVRSGLHCAPLAHESAGTLETGTVRLSFGLDASPTQNAVFRQIISQIHE